MGPQKEDGLYAVSLEWMTIEIYERLADTDLTMNSYDTGIIDWIMYAST